MYAADTLTKEGIGQKAFENPKTVFLLMKSETAHEPFLSCNEPRFVVPASTVLYLIRRR